MLCCVMCRVLRFYVGCLVFRVETVSVPAAVLVVAAVVLGPLVAMGLVAGGLVAGGLAAMGLVAGCLVAAVARVALVGL